MLKGVIWNIAPDAQIADLSHDVPPQDVLAGALLLERCTPYFPESSIHVVVVDPGVGTQRRPLAAQLGDQCFVGPDNGVFTLMLARAEAHSMPVRIVHTNDASYWLPRVSNIFHGRDIFAAVGAHLAAGVPLADLGDPVEDPIRLEIPEPRRLGAGWQVEVNHIDHFGNLSTRLRASQLEGMGRVVVRLKGRQIDGLVKTFGEQPSGALVALINSVGFLDISLVNGNAAEALGAVRGDLVEVFPQDGI